MESNSANLIRIVLPRAGYLDRVYADQHFAVPQAVKFRHTFNPGSIRGLPQLRRAGREVIRLLLVTARPVRIGQRLQTDWILPLRQFAGACCQLDGSCRIQQPLFLSIHEQARQGIRSHKVIGLRRHRLFQVGHGFRTLTSPPAQQCAAVEGSVVVRLKPMATSKSAIAALVF